MPPTLATFIACAIIAWLLYRNARAEPGVSFGLWIPTVWIMILASKPVVAWLGAGGGDADFETYLDGSPLDRNVLIVLLVLGISTLIRRRIQWNTAFRLNAWIIAYYLFMFASVFWSEYPFVAFKRCIREAGNFIMILMILTERDPAKALRQALVRCAFILIPLSVLTMKYYIEIGGYFNFWTGQAYYRGITTDKNALGRLTWVSYLFLLWAIAVRKPAGWFRWIKKCLPELFVLLMCLWVLWKAQSATSFACTMVGTTLFFALRNRWIRASRARLIALGFAIAAVGLLFIFAPDVRKLGANSLGRRADLTDRTDIWQGVFALDTNPLVGAGYSSFWLTKGGRHLTATLLVAEAHNGYLETYLNCGLIGVVFLCGVILLACRNILTQINSNASTAPLFGALVGATVLYNLTEASFNNSSLVGFLLWLMASRYYVPSPVYQMAPRRFSPLTA